MLAAANTPGADSTLSLVAGLAIVAVFAGAALLLGLRRWRRQGFARDPLHRSATRAASSPAPVAGPATGASMSTPPTPSDPHVGARGPAAAPQALAAPPRLPGARYSAETLEPLARRVDRSRRLVVAEERVREVLARLPSDRWLVDRYVLVGGRRVPFLILGETGVFALWPLDGAHNEADPAYFSETTAVIKHLLPGYPGPVQAVICRPLDPGLTPSWWYSPKGNAGAWVMGIGWLIPWLEQIGLDNGLGSKDVGRFDELAGPHWERRAVPVPLPRIPNHG